MNLLRTDIPDVVIIEPRVFRDDRGWFFESWNEQSLIGALEAIGLPAPRRFVQDNHSCSRAGVLRGLHYQARPHAQGKLVRVVRGAVYDVAVDIRRGSPTFGRWVGDELSASNRRQMWIPEGFAHGFLALEDDTEVIYKTTDVYAPACERCVRWDDPALAIGWPLKSGNKPLMAARDAAAPLLVSADLD